MYLLGALPLVLYLLGVLWHEKSLFCLPTKETFFSYIRLRRVILLRSDLRAPLIPTVGAALAAARRPLVPLPHHRGRSRTARPCSRAAEEPCLPLRGRCRAQRGGRGPSVILRSAATKDPAPGAGPVVPPADCLPASCHCHASAHTGVAIRPPTFPLRRIEASRRRRESACPPPAADTGQALFPQRSKNQRISVSPNGFSGTARRRKKGGFNFRRGR